MSDTSRSIVPIISNYPYPKKASKEILNWLISIDAIKSNFTNCILSSELGYAISDSANLLTEEPGFLPFNLAINGLQIITERTIFHNDLESFVCPKCNQSVIDCDWSAFFDDYITTDNSTPACPLCLQSSDLNQYLIEPEWGFSDLGFTFWNWPDLKQSFIKEFEERLNCKVRIIVTRL